MNLIIWIAGAVLLLAAFLLHPSPALLAALPVWVLVPPAAFLLVFLQRKNAGAAIEAPSTVSRDRPFEVKLLRKDAGRLRCGRVRAVLRTENVLTGEVTETLQDLTEGAAWTLCSRYCGSLLLTIRKLYLYDVFGVFRIPVPADARRRVTVMPDTFAVHVETAPSISWQDDCQEYAQDRKGPDPSEVYQIREYVPGDPLQQIHWKLSGKWGRLMLREGAFPVDHSLTVLFARSASENDPARADALAEAVSSICRALTEEGFPFRLGWNREGMMEYREISVQDQFPEAVASMLKAPFQKGEVSALELHLRGVQMAEQTRILYFGLELPEAATHYSGRAALQVFLCGEEAASGGSAGEEIVTVFAPETAAEELREIFCY